MSVVTETSDSSSETSTGSVTDPSVSGGSPAATPLRVRYRVRFAKVGLLRWTSHRDLARLWERLVRRASLKLSMTEGFHPKPRIGFPSALALGVEGLDEVVELELAEELSPQALLERLQADRQPGLNINRVSRLPDQFGKAQLCHSEYAITIVDQADRQQTQQAIDHLLSQATISFERKNKTITAEVKSQIAELALRGDHLHLTLAAIDSASLRPGDVLEQLGIGDWIQQGSTITRTRVVLQHEFVSDDPTMVAIAEAITESSESGGASSQTLGGPIHA